MDLLMWRKVKNLVLVAIFAFIKQLLVDSSGEKCKSNFIWYYFVMILYSTTWHFNLVLTQPCKTVRASSGKGGAWGWEIAWVNAGSKEDEAKLYQPIVFFQPLCRNGAMLVLHLTFDSPLRDFWNTWNLWAIDHAWICM